MKEKARHRQKKRYFSKEAKLKYTLEDFEELIMRFPDAAMKVYRKKKVSSELFAFGCDVLIKTSSLQVKNRFFLFLLKNQKEKHIKRC